MKLKKAIKILKKHNAWRRGDDHFQMQNPTELGIAIDTIVNHYEKEKDKYNLLGYPKEVVKLILKRQKEQSGKKDIEAFRKNIFADVDNGEGGFRWGNTKEGCWFWGEVLLNKNINLFFEKYPKKINRKN